MYAQTIRLSFKQHCKLHRFNAPTAVTLTMKKAIATGVAHWFQAGLLNPPADNKKETEIAKTKMDN